MTRHFMGIGGVGMAGLAFLLRREGCAVTGCDRFASARTRWLEANGIPVAIGHSPDHLDAVPDELVVTPAVPDGGPELARARACGVRIRRRGELLAEFFNDHPCGVAVCGSHGKTTTATFAAKLLRALGADPAWCIGGETGAWPVAGAAGRTHPFVVEADESDGTLALYRARILVITNVDYDHPERFRTDEDYRACFACAAAAARTVIRAEDLSVDDWPELAAFALAPHNARNARAAVEVAVRLGHSRAAIAAALPFALDALPDRRFQRVASAAGDPSTAVYADYAHHPRELACAIAMARSLGPKRLRVLFQPHRYTRTRALLNEFPPAFDGADETILLPVYAAFEKPVPGGDEADLYAAFRAHRGTEIDPSRPRLLLARSPGEAWRHVRLTLEPGDLVLVLGAGDVISLAPTIVRDLADRPFAARTWTPLAPLSFFRTGGRTCGGGARFVVGMGSNTWFSDCATDLEAVRAFDPHAEADGAEAGGFVSAALAGARLVARRPDLGFMAGIPGTVGGWTKMNAGAFGHAFSEAVVRVVTRDAAGNERVREASACGFAYRTSAIEDEIAAVELRPVPDPLPADCPTAAACLARRKAFPPRTCGSAFRNPPGADPAGKLLEAAGVKDLRVGGASVWREHANVPVAGEGCTASDLLALMRLMANAVHLRFGVRLEPEIRFA